MLKIVKGFRMDKRNRSVNPGSKTRSKRKEKRKVKGLTKVGKH